MRNLALIVFAFLLLVVQSALAAHISPHPWIPNLMLPIVIYLGVQQSVHLLRGAVLAFLFGFFTDEFAGSAIGLFTFLNVALFMVARGAGIRLFLRGTLFQVGLVFITSLIVSGTVLALRAIFSRAEPFALEMPLTGWSATVYESFGGDPESSRLGNIVGTTTTVLGSSIATALLAPPIFSIVRSIDEIRTRRREAADMTGTV